MQTFKLALLLCFCSIPLGIFSGQFYTHTFPSILEPGTEKTIILPFPYKELSEQDKKDTTLVLESRFVVLEKGSTRKALVGPLSPCHLIALTNGNKTIIFHYSLANKVKQACQLAQKILKAEAPSSKDQISGLVFANLTIPPERAARLKRDQKASIKKIKNTLVKKLDIQDPNKIQEVGFSFGTACNENNEQEYTKYMDHCELANRYILVDANITTYCTAPRKEDFFNTAISKEPFLWREKNSFYTFCKKMKEAFTKNQDELRTYNPYTIDLLDIDTSKETLENFALLSQKENAFEKPMNLKK